MNSKIKLSTWFINNPYTTIIGIGIFIRFIIAILYQHVNIYPDSSGYIYLGERLTTLSLDGYEGQRTPGYPLLLALSSNNMIITILSQNILGIITSIFLYKSLLLISFRKQHAVVFTLAITVYLPIIFFENCILSESLTLLIITLIFYFLFGIIYSERTGNLNYLTLSILCSYLVFIKPFYIFIPFIILLILLLHKRILHYRGSRYAIHRYIIIIILPTLTLTGWCSLNYINTGYFTPTTFYGFNSAQNCVAFAEKTNIEYKQIGEIYAKYRNANQGKGRTTAMSIWEAYDELEETTNLSFVDLSHLLYDYSIVTIKQNPLEYLKQVGISWIDFWKTSLYWQYDSFAIAHANTILKAICYAERILMHILKIIFVLFIPYNLLKYKTKKHYISPQFIISTIVLIASILQAFASYGTNSRFSFPFEILIATSAVMNIYAILETRKG